jgi:hypothetical protein
MQIRFGVIWEGPTIEAENHEIISSYTKALIDSSSSSSSQIIKQLETGRRYYPQNEYQTNFQKYPLLMVTHETYKKDIQPFILNQIKNLHNKNSDNCESNHRIIDIYNLQCFLYDVGKPIGGKQGMKSIVYDMVNNNYASTITEYPLC